MDSILDQNNNKGLRKNQIGDVFNQKEIDTDESPADANIKFKLKDRGTIESSKAQFKYNKQRGNLMDNLQFNSNSSKLNSFG